jgi:5-methylcytosine-specific restriction endonuclease McrA
MPISKNLHRWYPENFKGWKKCAQCLEWWPVKAYRPSKYPWEDGLQKICLNCNPSGIEVKYYDLLCVSCGKQRIWSKIKAKDWLCGNCKKTPKQRKKVAGDQIQSAKIRREIAEKHAELIPDYIKPEVCSPREWNKIHEYKKYSDSIKKLNERNRVLMQKRMVRAVREARLCNAPTNYTWEKWMEKCSFYGFRCVYCNIELTMQRGQKNTLTCDHFKPLSKGGTHFISNLLPACKSCNGRKWAHLGWKVKFRVGC